MSVRIQLGWLEISKCITASDLRINEINWRRQRQQQKK